MSRRPMPPPVRRNAAHRIPPDARARAVTGEADAATAIHAAAMGHPEELEELLATAGDADGWWWSGCIAALSRHVVATGRRRRFSVVASGQPAPVRDGT